MKTQRISAVFSAGPWHSVGPYFASYKEAWIVNIPNIWIQIEKVSLVCDECYDARVHVVCCIHVLDRRTLVIALGSSTGGHTNSWNPDIIRSLGLHEARWSGSSKGLVVVAQVAKSLQNDYCCTLAARWAWSRSLNIIQTQLEEEENFISGVFFCASLENQCAFGLCHGAAEYHSKCTHTNYSYSDIQVLLNIRCNMHGLDPLQVAEPYWYIVSRRHA